MDVCIGEWQGGTDDIVIFTAKTMSLLSTFTQGAHKMIKQYKLVSMMKN
jgi:hypothetical protein